MCSRPGALTVGALSRGGLVVVVAARCVQIDGHRFLSDNETVELGNVEDHRIGGQEGGEVGCERRRQG